LANLIDGIIYFGDDDNTYDWRLFNEMRTIQQVGVWPVGIVGGQLVETPLINNKCMRDEKIWREGKGYR
jgi:hypothetical protein